MRLASRLCSVSSWRGSIVIVLIFDEMQKKHGSVEYRHTGLLSFFLFPICKLRWNGMGYKRTRAYTTLGFLLPFNIRPVFSPKAMALGFFFWNVGNIGYLFFWFFLGCVGISMLRGKLGWLDRYRNYLHANVIPNETLLACSLACLLT